MHTRTDTPAPTCSLCLVPPASLGFIADRTEDMVSQSPPITLAQALPRSEDVFDTDETRPDLSTAAALRTPRPLSIIGSEEV